MMLVVMDASQVKRVSNYSMRRFLQARSSSVGFTLVELLVAMLIFSLLTMFAYRAVGMLADAKSTITSEDQLFSELQRFFIFLERDVRSAGSVSYSLDTEEGAKAVLSLRFASKAVGGSVEGGEDRTDGQQVYDVRYIYQDDKIFKQNFDLSGSRDAVSGKARSEGQSDMLLLVDGVTAFSIEQFGEMPAMAKGFVLTVDHEHFGQVKRILFNGMEVATAIDVDELNTLDVVQAVPTTIGGDTTDSGTEPEDPYVPDYADTVADDW